MCNTSGTTGNPNGVGYSHRSNWLHAMAAMTADSLGACERDIILPVVPMFHANAWGLAFAAPMVGARLVLPGPALDGPSVHALMLAHGVTHTAGVPTVWLGLMQHLRERRAGVPGLRLMSVGGAACPRALGDFFEGHHGVAGRRRAGGGGGRRGRRHARAGGRDGRAACGRTLGGGVVARGVRR